MKNTYFKILINFFELTFVITGIIMVCYLALGQILEITGDSMYPYLLDKQRILAEKVSPKFAEFKRGDIIVFKSPEESNRLVIKRIIGMPEEKIMLSEGKIYINDKPLEEAYLPNNTKTKGTEKFKDTIEFTIPYKTYFVLGDNREKSIDSRYWGVVSKELIIGKPLFVYKPLNQFKLLF